MAQSFYIKIPYNIVNPIGNSKEKKISTKNFQNIDLNNESYNDKNFYRKIIVQFIVNITEKIRQDHHYQRRTSYQGTITNQAQNFSLHGPRMGMINAIEGLSENDFNNNDIDIYIIKNKNGLIFSQQNRSITNPRQNAYTVDQLAELIMNDGEVKTRGLPQYIGILTRLQNQIISYKSEDLQEKNNVDSNIRDTEKDIKELEEKQKSNTKLNNYKNYLVLDILNLHYQILMRTCEGCFINSTLKNMRSKMTMVIKESIGDQKLVPNFTAKCIDVYANPYIEEMFGSENNKNSTECEIHKIIAKTNASKLNYCVCLVINNSYKDAQDILVNNPPTIPYIDLTEGYMELNRYMAITDKQTSKGIIFGKDKSEKRTINIEQFLKDKINSITGYDYHHFVNQNTNINVFKTILDYFQQQYRFCIMKYKNFSESKVDEINKIYSEVKDSQTRRKKIKCLKQFLDNINIMNSTSIIGTIEFLDQMSKYNLKFNACNFRYSQSGFLKLEKGKKKDKSSYEVFKEFKYETYPLLYNQNDPDVGNFINEKILNVLDQSQPQSQQPGKAQQSQQSSQAQQSQPSGKRQVTKTSKQSRQPLIGRQQSRQISSGRSGGSRKKSRKIKNRIVKKHRKTRNKRGNVFKKRFRFNKKNRKQSRLT